jgi:predicted TIM-barrel fold metal-dependent hydrolase
VDRLMRSVPEARFVVLDGLMTLASTEVLTDAAAEQGNVWLDTANALPVRRVVQTVGEKVGWDRVVFGSCFYAGTYSYQLCSPLEEFLASVGDEQIRRAVLHDNLRAVFGATPAAVDG